MPYFRGPSVVNRLSFGFVATRSLKEPIAFSRSISGFQLSAIRDATVRLSDPDT